MVMKYMRAGTKPVLWIIVAAFVGTIIFAWGMDFTARPATRGVIGKVNGQELKIDEYSLLCQNAIAQQQQQKPDLKDEEIRKIRDDVFSQMVASRILREYVDKIGLEVTNSELAEHLRRYPPREVQQAEVFMTNGQFDYNKYMQAYRNPDPQLWVQIEALTKPRVLQQKLYEYVSATVRVDDPEMKDLYTAASEKIKVRYVFLASGQYRDSIGTVDSTKAREYYQQHASEFTHDERAQLAYVSLPKYASAEDSAEVMRDAQALAERAKGGEDFAQLARQYSEDGSAQNGGDLGWFGRGAMVAPFDSAAFALDSGQISPPVQSQFGYHIIKSEGKRTKGDTVEVHAVHILLRVQASSTTLSDLRIRAEQFVSDARKEGFDAVAAREKLEIIRSGWFERGKSILGIGDEPGVTEFAFSASKGTISDPFDTQDKYLITVLSDHQPAGQASFSDVSSNIISKLTAQLSRSMAAERLRPVREQIASGVPMAQAAAAAKATYDSTDYFGRFERAGRFGEDPDFRGVAFSLSAAQPLSQVAKITFGAVVIQQVDRQAANLEFYTQKRDSIMTAALDGKRQMIYNNWYNDLLKKSDIKDYRYQSGEIY
ncbi:MAG: peptidylprolyl isomerase [candidate division Zixibacteria bacterium]|nr:peptidylprolyl isomerase [candidate division Zixibacteria bacterium]